MFSPLAASSGLHWCVLGLVFIHIHVFEIMCFLGFLRWMSLGNQLQGVRLVDEGLRARFKAAYPDVEVQPSSPPRPSAMDVDTNSAQMRSPFVGLESKPASQYGESTAPEGYTSEEKPMAPDVEMAG